MPDTSAEIPPADAPSGFDSAAFFILSLVIFNICAAPLRMTRRLIVTWVIQYSSVIVTLQRIDYIPQNIILTVSFQSKRLRRSVEPRRGAGRRNLGTRARHPNELRPAHKTSAKPHPAKNPRLPKQQKNFPTEPRHHKSETNFRSCNGGVLWESSR